MTILFALVRALHFASLMSIFGASALQAQTRNVVPADVRLYRPLFLASLMALATAALWLCFVSAEMTASGVFDLNAIGAVVSKSAFGNVFLVRLGLLAWLCFLCLAGGPPARTLVAGAALGLLSFVSHAAAAGEPFYYFARAAIDALHLLSAGFWVGGLLVLASEVLTRPRDNIRLIALLRQFSRYGAVAVAVLVAAGTLNGVAVLDVPGMRWSDTYLTWLAVKLVLAGVMVALALTNRFGVLPGLERGEKEAAETIPLTVIAELACAALILFAVGFLGLTAPMQM